MKGIGILRGSSIMPNHRAPNPQFALSLTSFPLCLSVFLLACVLLPGQMFLALIKKSFNWEIFC